MTKEKFEHYKESIIQDSLSEMKKKPFLRFGQTLYNLVAKDYANILNSFIVGRNCDPFYDNRNIDMFWEELENHLVTE